MTILSEGILRLRAEGKTYSEIQKELGCSKGTISYHLGMGQKESSLERGRYRRTKIDRYLRDLKNETPCVDCGENYPYWVMDFDHLEGKEFGLARYQYTSENMDRVKAEVAKCEVVCSNCHRGRTHLRSVKSLSPQTEEWHNRFNL